jgi:hypothetical protein
MDAQKKSYKLDHDLIFKLASMHCTYEEIADCVGTSVATLQKRFKNLIDKGRAEGKKSLRRAQFEKALAGDARMLMFLGKNWLGQQDSPTDEESTAPLPWEDK